MHFDLLMVYRKLRLVLAEESGQELVEYALVIALLALACVVGMRSLATNLSSGLTTIGTRVTNSI
jgi:pilus assembly protein Flp/PilA